MSDADDAFTHNMSAPDAVLWDIEKDPVLRSTITAIALLDRSPDWDRLVARLRQGVAEIPRLRQRVIVPPLRLGPPRWVDDPDFDLDYHLRRVRAPGAGTFRDVLDVAEPIAMDSFDRARPLWEFTLVEGMEDGQAALIQKVHHSLTDGVGGMRLALMLVDDERFPSEQVEPVELPSAPAVSRLGVLAGSLAETAGLLAGQLTALPSATGRAVVGLARDPAGSAQHAAELAGSVWRSVAPVTEPASPLMRRRSLGRRFETLEVPVADLKAAAHAVGGKLNDAFLAGAVGGVQRYHERHEAPADELRVTMPINFRLEDDPLGGNRFAPARFAMPATIADASRRMQILGDLAREWQREPAIAHTDQLAGVLDRLPVTLLTSVFGGMLKSIDLVATNVPGIPVPVYLAGGAIDREYAFAPPTGAALSIALLSHVDTACVGLVIDTAAVPDPEVLRDCLVEGFDEVVAVASHHARATSD